MNWRLSAVNLMLRALGNRRSTGSTESVVAEIRRLQTTKKVPLPRGRSLAGLEFGSRTAKDMTIRDLRPKQRQPVARILYLHGGSYTYEISPFHWRFLTQLAREAPAEIAVPIYPLAPIETAGHTVPAATDLLEEMVDAGGPVILMGDSAGGGMALAVAQQLVQRGKQPDRLVLIAPWLDVSMTDPKLREYESRDLMLDAGRLAICGQLYAGDLDVRDPLASPLYGSLDDLAPIDMFTGADDMLNADAHRLVERASVAGASVRLHEVARMPHAYPLIPLLHEARQARAQIVALTAGTA